jgi:hypothetical protein
LTIFLVRFGIGVPVIVYSKDGALGGLDSITLETLITSFLALPLTCGVEITLFLSNYFLFFLLLTRKGPWPKEKCLRVLVLGLRARFGRELPPGDPPACRLD